MQRVSVLSLILSAATVVACDSGSSGSDSNGSTSGAEGGSMSQGDSGSSSGATEESSGGEVDGQAKYNGLCMSCHGDMAQGTTLGYELRHPNRDYAEWVVRNGRSGTELAPSVMAAYITAIVSDAELAAIFDYLDTFPQPTDGAGLYEDYCRNCHGPDAKGGESGVDMTIQAGPAVLAKVRAGGGGNNYGSRTSYMPVFDEAQLSDEEVQMIVDYVGTL